MLSKKSLYRAACLAALLFVFACGGGDDDGRRLGEVIVGTWQRGWGEGDVVIEGDTDLRPENFAYDQFVFNDDGSYNGMVREGTFMEPNGEGKMLAQVVYFTDDTLQLRYENEEYNVTVTFIVRKL